jgi:hypothetical protein
MAPRRSPSDGHLDRGPRDEQQAREAERAAKKPENHGGTVAKLADSNEFSATVNGGGSSCIS